MQPSAETSELRVEPLCETGAPRQRENGRGLGYEGREEHLSVRADVGRQIEVESYYNKREWLVINKGMNTGTEKM